MGRPVRRRPQGWPAAPARPERRSCPSGPAAQDHGQGSLARQQHFLAMSPSASSIAVAGTRPRVPRIHVAGARRHDAPPLDNLHDAPSSAAPTCNTAHPPTTRAAPHPLGPGERCDLGVPCPPRAATHERRRIMPRRRSWRAGGESEKGPERGMGRGDCFSVTAAHEGPAVARAEGKCPGRREADTVGAHCTSAVSLTVGGRGGGNRPHRSWPGCSMPANCEEHVAATLRHIESASTNVNRRANAAAAAEMPGRPSQLATFTPRHRPLRRTRSLRRPHRTRRGRGTARTRRLRARTSR